MKIILPFFCLFLSTAHAITVNLSLPSVNLAYGNAINATCKVSTDDEISYFIWKQNGTVVANTSVNFLTIRNITHHLNGENVSCIAMSMSGNISLDSKTLEVYDLQLTASSTVVLSGASLIITCKASGSGEIEYQFFKNGRNITNFQSSNTLRYHRKGLKTANAGIYRCDARINNISRRSNVVSVNVTVFAMPRPMAGYEGKGVNITCVVIGGEVMQSYTWKVNNKTKNETSKYLQLQNITLDMFGWKIGCSATSFTGVKSNEYTSHFRVYYFHDPTIRLLWNTTKRTEGRRIDLECNYALYPHQDFNITWFKEGRVINYHGRYLSYASSRTDTGNYSCMVNNTFFSQVRYSNVQFLEVIYMDKPTVNITKSRDVIVEGDDLFFYCYVKAYHPSLSITYSWLKDRKPDGGYYVMSRNQTFSLKNINRNQGGRYVCNARTIFMDDQNRREKIEKDSEEIIDVHYPPHNLGISLDKDFHKVPLGSTYKLTCSLSNYGNPKATIHWFKHSDKTPLQSGIPGFPLTMNIKAMNEQNISYVCVANNSVAEVRKEVNITIVVVMTVNLTLPSVNLAYGNAINATCKVSTDDEISYFIWKQNGTVVANTSVNFLTIKNITHHLNGENVSCTARNIMGETSSDIKTLDVYDLQLKASSQSVLSGSALTITCKASSPGEIEYMFYKDDYNITNYQVDNSLRYFMKNLTTANAGEYRCDSRINNTTRQSNIVSVNVTIHTWLFGLAGYEGKNVNISCHVFGKDAIKFYTWKVNDRIQNETSKYLQIQNITLAMFGWKIGCSATTFTGIKSNEYTSHFSVYYFHDPTIKLLWQTNKRKEGDRIDLECDYRIFPHRNFNITWFKDGKVINYHVRQLSYASSRSDTGNYSCMVNSTFFSQARYSNVQFLEVIYMDKPTVNITKSRKTFVVEGDDLFFYCYIKAYHSSLSITYSWLKEIKPHGGYYVMSRNQTFSLTNIESDQGGRYVCRAITIFMKENNSTSKIERESEEVIDVYYLPHNLVILPDKEFHKVQVGSAYNLTCSLSSYGNPKATLHWFKYGDGTPLKSGTSGSTLTMEIKAISKQDTSYVCAANNSAGEVRKNVNITVLEKPDAPQNLHVISKPPATFEVTWTAPSYNGNAAISMYILRYKSLSHLNYHRVNVTSSLKVNISNLIYGKTYVVKVQAVNAYGESEEAKLETNMTAEGVPSPVEVNQTIFGETSISIYWGESKNINGILQGYNVTWSSPGKKVCNTRACLFSELRPFQNYTVFVHVYNTLCFATTQKIVSTRPIVPKPLDKPVPIPPADKISNTSFGINIVLFKEEVGSIKHYDVIAWKLQDKELPSKSPNDFSNEEIKDKLVGRLINPKENELFIIGSSVTNRKRRSLGTPNNSALEPNTYYVAFVRVYITDIDYQSSPWYGPVQTKSTNSDAGDKDDDDDKNHTTVIVIGVLIAVIVLIVIVYVIIRTKNNSYNTTHVISYKKTDEHEMICH
ncbi:cell adhesion molecule DSCAM-like isoform X2 [Hydractinia symbiolongicarpus]|nr:cell adhesion molecule DSCAM-like isoform X2 [Hydractinia symbiolongicarpus]XP_057300152.1 cell adhesion molecule DSCAM-like isoform X2 [Hydractinia symbiolongicarpus]